ncbi:hypothetical protein E2562_023792 [Oryza meyeriana var. granulata]|uniref:Uncharacterized protein n=1 Tax=Oryza meyeriana var. granulata TaxID=110450 RepID=A0A6G1DNN8_9ORYZ|nr:hypothetical protein E2562_023792 [Oryza meyeriana var. granulata]
MGSCASVHKDLGFPKKLFLASPTKEKKAVNGKGALVGDGFVDLKRKVEGEQQQPPAGVGTKSPGSGSKDEMFFDSRAWLDSDCEDDFYSVNGDFTPSRGSTPNYQPRTQTVMSNVFVPDNVHNSKSPEPSPTGRRKLAELLQEAMQNGSEESTDAFVLDIGNNEKHQLQSVSAAVKPVSESSSACSTEPTPVREAKNRKEKAWYSGRCCLPPSL